MAKLREQFNLTTLEVSERLHIRARYVNAIEEGRYELMPGKVYARGYVHTYAEFLGLDAEQVVAQCFAGELPANVQPAPVMTHTLSRGGVYNPSVSMGKWRGYAVAGAAVLALLLVISQFTGHDGEAEREQTSVAPVPEAMLASVRNLVMPTPQNYTCLTDDAVLSCFNADTLVYTIDHLDEGQLYYGGEIDVSEYSLAPAEKTEEEPSGDEAPAKSGEDE